MTKAILHFSECTRDRPCPICLKSDWCCHTQEGPVKCMRYDREGLSQPSGWTPAKQQTPDDGRMFYPPGWGERERRPVDPVELNKAKQDADKKTKGKLNRALRWWADAAKHDGGGGPDHPELRAYLAARGIDVAMLPGGRVPEALRYHPRCPDTWADDAKDWHRFRAMIAKVQGPDGEHTAVHRTFLDPEGAPSKRPASFGKARKMYGPVSGGAVRLCNNFARGVLIVGEGIETCLACLQATGVATWAALDEKHLQALRLPPRVVQANRAEAVSVVIIAADQDNNGVGQRAATILANLIRQAHPWVTIAVRYPTSRLCPELISGDESDPTGGADVASNGKGVDWRDVLERYGPDRVRSGLLAGIDFETAARRAFAWQPGQLPPPPVPPPGGQGGGGGVPGWSAGDTAGDGEDAVQFIDDSPLLRAQRYLLEQESPPEELRPGVTWYIRRWGGKWWEYDGRAYFELDDEALHGRVQQWLDRFWSVTKRGEQERLDPSSKMVEEVIKAMRSECLVDTVQMPTWVPATFDARGLPVWGLASRARRFRTETSDRPGPGSLIAYHNCLLDSAAWTEGRMDVYRHDPRYFCGSCLPFPLPVDKLKGALQGTEGRPAEMAAALGELAARLAPRWVAFLDRVSKGEPNWVRCLQQWMGYNLIHDVHTIQKILVLQGPTRSGKGTILRVFRHVLGAHNVASTSLKALTERFGLSDLVGKLAAVMPDAHLGKFDDMTAAVEALKAISGGDAVRVEEKYAKRAPTIVLTCRFTCAVNKMPSLADGSGALAGRLVILPMADSFLGKEDKRLGNRLLEEAEGVNVWMLAGLADLLGQEDPQLALPNSARDAMKEFADDSAPVQLFVEECCELRPGAREWVDDLFLAWRRWCATGGRYPGSRENLGKLLKAQYGGMVQIQDPETDQRDGKRKRRYEGLRLLEGVLDDARAAEGAGASAGLFRTPWRPSAAAVPARYAARAAGSEGKGTPLLPDLDADEVIPF